MARKQQLKLWYDKEGDYLQVLFNDDAGTFEETEHEQIMVRMNQRDEVIGLSILNISKLDGGHLDLALQPARGHI